LFRRLFIFFVTPVFLIVVAAGVRFGAEIYRKRSPVGENGHAGSDSMSSSLPHVIPFKPLARKRPVPSTLPPEIADFYGSNEGYCPVMPEYIVGLFPLKNVEVGTGAIVHWLATSYERDPENPWLRTEVVLLGRDSFGDDIFYAASSPARLDGGIYLIGPDVGGPQGSDVQADNVLCVASSFASWLEHLRTNDWIEYGVVPGEMSNLPKAKQAELRRYYAALNPKLDW
jgi:hypothetical protein